jgi:hypothetical protein
MADRKISDLTALTAPAAGDYLPIVDISEVAAASKNKRITIEELFRGTPDGTAAAPAIAPESDPNTGIYSSGADQLSIATNGTERLKIDANGTVLLKGTERLVFNTYVSDSNHAGYIGRNTSTGALVIEAQNAGGGYPMTFRTNSQERLRITDAGLVGIGTSSPDALLTVNGVGAHGLGSAAAPSFAFTGDLNTGIYSPGADQLAISTNGTGRLFVDASGNVGVGNTVSSLSFASGTGSLLYGAGVTRFVIKNADTGTGQYAGFEMNCGTSGAGAFVQWQNQPITWLTNNGSSVSERMRLTSAGLLGLGTSSPGALLHVEGGSENAIIGSSSRKLYFRADSSGVSLSTAAAQAGTGFYFNEASNFIYAQTNTTERARIDSSGRLLVGTSTARENFFNSSFAGATAALQLEGTGQNRRMSIVGDDFEPFVILGLQKSGSPGGNTIVANGDGVGVLSFQGNDGSDFVELASIRCAVDGTPGANDMPGRLVFSTTADGAASPTERMRINSNGAVGTFTVDGVTSLGVSTAATAGTATIAAAIRYGATAVYGGTISLQIYSNGNVQNTNNSYGAISDIKLKENIVDANSQWDDLKALQVRNYNFKEGQTHTQIGLVAQEVELVSPGLVSESPDRDADGNDLGTVTKSVNYSVLYMKAVKALQEAMERIEALEADVAQLKGA